MPCVRGKYEISTSNWTVYMLSLSKLHGPPLFGGPCSEDQWYPWYSNTPERTGRELRSAIADLEPWGYNTDLTVHSSCHLARLKAFYKYDRRQCLLFMLITAGCTYWGALIGYFPLIHLNGCRSSIVCSKHYIRMERMQEKEAAFLQIFNLIAVSSLNTVGNFWLLQERKVFCQ